MNLSLSSIKLKVGSLKAPALTGACSAVGHSGGFLRFAVPEFFHASFICLATEYPPIDVIQPDRVAGAATLVSECNQVALFQCHDEFPAIATVTVFVNSHPPHGSVQRSH